MALVTLLAGCRHKTEPQPVEIPQHVEDADIVDKRHAITPIPQVADTGMALHWDTMPVHDRRKKPVVFYTPEQVAGEWIFGTQHEMYNADGTGMAWDLGDDVQIEEAKTFVWRLEENILTTYYPLAVGGLVPKMIHVVHLDSIKMILKDDYGCEYKYLRAPQGMRIERISCER